MRCSNRLECFRKGFATPSGAANRQSPAIPRRQGVHTQGLFGVRPGRENGTTWKRTDQTEIAGQPGPGEPSVRSKPKNDSSYRPAPQAGPANVPT
jgi:hypothetical protein